MLVFLLTVVMRGYGCLSQYGDTALLLACLSGRIDVARWLVSEAGSDARSERNNVGRCGNAASACLVSHVVILGDVMSQDGETALLCACYKGHIDVARWLVSEAGSDARSERSNVGRCDDAACGCVVVVCHSVCVAMCFRRVGVQRFCRHATKVTWSWRGGLCQRPAAMRGRSETMSVAVVMLHMLVLFCSLW